VNQEIIPDEETEKSAFLIGLYVRKRLDVASVSRRSEELRLYNLV
jgi:hypothetical protein